MKLLGVATVAILMCAMDVELLAQQSATPIFNGNDLTGWTADRTPAEVVAGVLTVRPGPGWLRFNRVLSNFALTMEVRLGEPDAKAGIFIRSWPTFDAATVPSNGYRVVVGATGSGAEYAGRVMGHGRSARERLADRSVAERAMIAKDGWHRYEIESQGNSLRVSLDGTVVTEIEGVQNPQGFLALRSDSGSVELRGIVLRDLRPSRPVPPAGAFAIGGGVAGPSVRRDVKPRYTADAMKRRIQGNVVMSVVVQPDGTTGDVSIEQSLDPEFGLDEEALTAARQWRFTPGTRNGDPVPVLVTIEMTFTLK